MGYIESQLLPNERIVAHTARHKIVLVLPVLGALILAAAGIGASVANLAIGFVAAPIGLAVIAGLAAWMNYRSAEFAVTTSRLILKQGLLSTRTLELQLNKVEAVNVDQTLFGRIMGYGTLEVGGTGGTKEIFSIVNHPAEFRTQVQGQINAINDRPEYSPMTLSTRRDPARAERPCPFCAEPILAAAKICRFCNRDVSATAS
jgi:uncharacterized membrane protein YdbT with pleckstrin-like domain